MKHFLVIGNPINHSYSPQLHNYWFKKYNINAVYKKEKLNFSDLKDLSSRIKNSELNGVNVTVPFKKDIIPYLDELSLEAKNTQSVNTIHLIDNKLIGHNTDVEGFKKAIEETKFDINGKTIFILGAGGVVPSIIYALNKMNISEIIVSNRTRNKADILKNSFNNISIVDWGVTPNFDMIINATSLGLNDKDEINLDFSKVKKENFFYDVIYSPQETNFLKKAKDMGNKTENGKKMFIYQAAAAFNIWHNLYPEIDEELFKIFYK